MVRSGPLLLLVALALGTGVWTGPASAQATPRQNAGQANSAEKKREAAKEFREGVKAFKQRKFKEAAEHFEKANEIAPNEKALWNAAESHEKAGDIPRAANLYQRFLEVSPPEHKDRAEAEARLVNIAALIGRLELTGQDATEVTVDGEPASQGAVVFVDPGDHTVRATLVTGELVQKRVQVKGGMLVRVALEMPKPERAPEPVAAPDDSDKAVARKSGWSPTVFYVGIAATGALGIVSTVSGLDTQAKRRDFDAAPTAQGYDEGVAAQKRTNLLLGATAVVGVATAAVGLFAVRWDDGKEAAVSVAPRNVTLRMRF